MSDEYKPDGRIAGKYYNHELLRLQEELVDLQEWIKQEGLKVAVIFEERDAAGKGGVIKRITQRLNHRIVRVVALGIPTEREKSQWYFQRYVPHLPSAGEIVLFDRSWYNRAGVESVMGFCTDDEYREFLWSCPDFERMLVQSGMILIKYWFEISAEEQERRFRSRLSDPRKRWKIGPVDVASRARWTDYSRARGCDVHPHRHRRGALVRGRRRCETTRSPELHSSPPGDDFLRGDRRGGDRAPGLTAGRDVSTPPNKQHEVGSGDLRVGSCRRRAGFGRG